MNGYRKLLLLVIIMASVSLVVGGIAIGGLYSAALAEQRASLINTVQSQKYLLEAVARFNRQHLKDFAEGHEAATLRQFDDAHRRYPGFARTGGFALGRRVDGNIIFEHSHRAGLDRPQPIPFDSTLAEPMRRALLGEQGTVIGPDYQGTQVLAAFAPVNELDLGIVAKIDLAEVRAPFIRAGVYAAAAGLIVVLIGTLIFYRLSEPMIRQLYDSEARFRTIFEQAAVGVALVETSTGRLSRVNSRYADLLGYSVDELIDHTPEEFAGHGDGLQDSKNMQRLIAGEIRDFTTERRCVRRDGTQVWVNLTVSATWPARQTPTYHIAIMQDISERKAAEAELHLKTQAIDTGATAIVFANMEGRVTYANRAFAELWGYDDEQQVVGMPNVVFSSSPQDVGEVMESLRERGRWIGERLARKRDGTLFEVQVSASVVSGDDGQPVLAMASLVDISGLKRAELAVRESDQRYRDLFNSTHDLICTVAPDGHFLYVNRAWLQALGYGREELTEITFADIIHSECRDAFQAHLKRMMEGESVDGIEATLVSKTGQTIYVEGHGSPRFQEGQIVGAYGFLRDVSLRRRAEHALREQRDFAERLIRTAQSIVLVLDRQGRIVRFNPYLQELCGWRLEDLQGRDFVETFFSEEAREAVRATFRQALGGQRPRAHVHRIRTRDGAERDIQWHDAPLTDANGELIGLLCTGLDITEQLQAERAVRANEQRLRAILNAATDAIITIDQSGVMQDVNAAAERMFGYNAEELLGRNVSLLMPAPFREEHNQFIARYLHAGHAKIMGGGREVVARHRDGTTFPVDLAVSEVGHLQLFTGIVRDMREQKELQRQVLEIAAEEQRRIGQELHDGTQQELTGLNLMAQNLVDTLAAKPQEFLTQHGLDRLQRVANRLSVGLSETNKSVQMMARGLIPVEVDSQGLMSALAELAATISDVHPVRCTFQCGRPVELADNFTATHLYRIAQEAVTNALKHGQPEQIDIRLVQELDGMQLTVSDNGRGFDPTSAGNGGRGLPIMSYRASLIGGALSIAPQDHGGTLVSCSLSTRKLV